MATEDNRTVTARLDEAFLTLLKDLTEVLAADWSQLTDSDSKRCISKAMCRALEIRI